MNLSPRKYRQRGAGLVETLIVIPTLLMVIMATWQAAMVFRAKSAVNYAVFEAARAGAVQNAKVDAITAAFAKGMIPYYGGGRDAGQLAVAAANVAADLAQGALRIQILSPTQESFKDYASPELRTKLKADEPVIPNSALDQLQCPRDVPGCNHDPDNNESGQIMADANLLKLKVSYGIPPAKQMPLAGKFYTWALDQMGTGDDDPFVKGLIEAQRIPVIAHVVVRMQSEAIRNTAMVSDPGPGNKGDPQDPGDPPDPPDLPQCPWWDPTCSSCPGGSDDPKCKPHPCPDGKCEPCDKKTV
jgi:TadE-like protein